MNNNLTVHKCCPLMYFNEQYQLNLLSVAGNRDIRHMCALRTYFFKTIDQNHHNQFIHSGTSIFLNYRSSAVEMLNFGRFFVFCHFWYMETNFVFLDFLAKFRTKRMNFSARLCDSEVSLIFSRFFHFSNNFSKYVFLNVENGFLAMQQNNQFP